MSTSYPKPCEYCEERQLKCSLRTRPRSISCRNCKGRRECVKSAQPHPYAVPIIHQSVPRRDSRAWPRLSRTRPLVSSRASSESIVLSNGGHNRGSLLQPELTKLIISLDVGSGNIKAAWRAVFDNPQQRALCDKLISGCKDVMWDNHQLSCTAKLAYRFRKGQSGVVDFDQLWGVDVDEALIEQGGANVHVLQWLKPALFSSSTTPTFHEVDLEERLARLKRVAGRSGISDMTHFHNLNSRRLYADLLGHAYNYVLSKAREGCPAVDRLYKSRPEALRDMIEVALPVPATASGIQEMMVLEAGKQAGLPKAFPVAEPAAAAAFTMQNLCEEQYHSEQTHTSTTGTILVLDAGEGTLDAVVCTIQSELGLQSSSTDSTDGSDHPRVRHFLKEAVPGMSQWRGGSSVNEAFRHWIQTEYKDQIEAALNEPFLPFTSEAELLDLLVQDFEDRKRGFSGDDSRPVNVGIRDFALFIPLKISPSTMKGFFKEQLQASYHLINQLKLKLQQTNRTSGGSSRVEQLILVGGANDSKYIQNEIRRKYQSIIPVVQPQQYGHTLTAKGGLLIAVDKAFIAERFLLHSYFFKWDDRTREKRGKSDGSLVVIHDEAMDERRAQDVSRVILKAGDRVPWRHTVKLPKGVRTLPKKPEFDDTGFDHQKELYLIEEEFFMSDVSSTDGLNIYFAPNDFLSIGTLKFEIDRLWCRENCSQQLTSRSNIEFWSVEYEVSVTITGMNIEFSIGIPQNGTFDGDDEQEYAIFKKGSIDWNDAGGFWKV